MLSGLKFLSASETEKQLKREKKEQKKQRKKRKKETKKLKAEKWKEAVADKASTSSVSHRDDDEMQFDSSDTAQSPKSVQEKVDEHTRSEAGLLREDWMTVPMQRSRPPPDDDAVAMKEDVAKPKISVNELNPDMAKERDGTAAVATSKTESVGVGDGGASWRMKALKRAQHQAAAGGEELDTLVAERWGSLRQLTEKLTTSKAAHGRAHLHAAKNRKSDKEADAGSGAVAHYLSDLKSETVQMRRPTGGDTLSWRKDRRRDEGRQGEGGGDGDGDGSNAGRSGDGRHAVSAGRGRHDDMSDRQYGRGQKEGDRQGVRHSRQHNDSTHGAAEGRRRPGHSRNPLGRAEDAEALRSATAHLNQFSSDGSFMEKFNAVQAPAERDVQTLKDEGEEGHESAGRRRIIPEAAATDAADACDVAATAAPQRGVSAGLKGRLGGGPAQGNQSVADALRARLKGVSKPQEGSGQPEVLHLPLLDESGRPVPGAFGRDTNTKLAGHSRRLQADDDNADLATVVRRQRYEGEGNIDNVLADNIMSSKRFRTQHMDADEEYDHDGTVHMYQKKKPKSVEDQKSKDKQHQVRQYNKMNALLDSCPYCIASAKRQRHLTIALGQTTYLALPDRGRLVPGHVTIMPVDHVASTRQLDDHVWTEMRNFKKCLIRMFADQGKMAIFWETAMNVSGMTSHARVDCVPVSTAVFQKAPLYFKKGIDDAESEWSQHHAKRLIDTTHKGLRGSIPPNFPYFNVEFGLTGGYVHVIDDEKKFPKNFGRSIMVGLVKLPEEDMHRKAQADSITAQKQWAAEFIKQFDPYDWTKQLMDG